MGAAPLRKLGTWLREKYGEPVHKVGVTAGFPCPNRDGTIGSAGCSFCNPASSMPPGGIPGEGVTAQLAKGIEAVSRRFGARKFIAYFQDCTPTNCLPGQLESLLEEASRFPGVVGLAICTRPDSLQDGMLDMMASISSRVPLWVEIGLQSACDRTLVEMGRNHTAGDCLTAIRELRRRGIDACLHVILGLPGETRADHAGTARFLNSSGAWGVKIHNLQVLRGTGMERLFAEGLVAVPSLEEYADRAAAFLGVLDRRMVIHRLVADAPESLLIAPSWNRDKQAVLRAIEKRLGESSGG